MTEPAKPLQNTAYRHAHSRTGSARSLTPPGTGPGGLLRSSAIMAIGTLVSRTTGLVRLVLQAAALGVKQLAGTYNTANTVPISLHTLLIGGALNSVLVPQLVKARGEHPDGGRAHEQRLATLVLAVVAAGTVAAVAAAPQIAALYVPDTPGNHQAFELTVVLARYLLPQIFFYGLFFISGQILSARGRFGAMMWAPVLNNVILISLFGLYLGLVHGPTGVDAVTPADVRLLGIGSTVGIALQALSLLPYLRDAGFRWRPRFDWRGTGLGKSIAAARWTLLFVLVNQVALTIVTHFANSAEAQLPKAGVGSAAYFNAQSIWSLPQSIVTVSLATALLPRISRAAAEQRLDDVREELSRGLRTTGSAIVPAAVFFLLFGPQVAVLLFAHGATAAAATRPLGHMLQAFALGLIPYSGQYLLLRGFYALEDTRTPFWTGVWISGSDIALAAACHLALPARWAVTGMAAAYAASYGIGMLVTAARLRRRLAGRLDGKRLLRSYGKLAAAAGCAGGAGWAAARLSAGLVAGPAAASAAALVAGGAVMAALFVLLARVLGISGLPALPGRG